MTMARRGFKDNVTGPGRVSVQNVVSGTSIIHRGQFYNATWYWLWVALLGQSIICTPLSLMTLTTDIESETTSANDA